MSITKERKTTIHITGQELEDIIVKYCKERYPAEEINNFSVSIREPKFCGGGYLKGNATLTIIHKD